MAYPPRPVRPLPGAPAEDTDEGARTGLVTRIIIVGTIVLGQLWALTVALEAYLLGETSHAWGSRRLLGHVVRGRAAAGAPRPRSPRRPQPPRPPMTAGPQPPRHPGRPRRPGPIGGDMAAVLHGLAERLRLPAPPRRSTAVLGLFAFTNGLISIGVMAAAALVTGAPLIFPSLGPTAFLLFYTPLQPAASPRNTLGGHLIGAAAGYLSLAVFGLLDQGPA